MIGNLHSQTRTFPVADVGSDHDLIILNFRVRHKNIKRPKNTRLKFDLDKLRNPSIHETFQTKVVGKFAALLTLEEDRETMANKFNETMCKIPAEGCPLTTLDRLLFKPNAVATKKEKNLCPDF